jgi:RNA polymerase sigma factor (sigma-70 family)
MLNCRPLPERRRTAVIFVGVLSCIRGSQSFLPVSPFRIQTRGSESALWSTKNGNTQPQRGASLTLKPLAPIKPKNGLEKKKKLSQDEADQSEIPAVKRGRGRPRKTTSTTPTVPKKVYNVVRSNHDYSRYEMLDHELLTADEEQILGNKVKRAIQLRKQIQGTVEIQRGKQEKNPRPGYLYESDDMEEEEDDDEEDGDDAALFSGSKANTYFGDNFQDDAMAELSVYGKGEKTLMEFDQDSLSSIATAAYSGGDYMDYELDNSNSEPLTFDDKQTSSQSILDDRLLTEEYIVHTLKVEGGRAELYHIFMEGALARDKMIRSNIRLVVSIAKKWALQSSRGLGNQNDHRLQSVYAGSWNRPSLDEAIQEGIIGLSTAADRFEPDRKLKFGTYATWWITSYVRKCFQTASTGCLRIPPNFHSIKHKYQQIVKRNYDYEGDIPPIKEIAEEMGLAVKRLQFVLDSTRTLLSIDAPLSKGSIPGQAGKSGSAEANGGESTLLKNSLAWYVIPLVVPVLELAVKLYLTYFSSTTAPSHNQRIKSNSLSFDSASRMPWPRNCLPMKEMC